MRPAPIGHPSRRSRLAVAVAVAASLLALVANAPAASGQEPEEPAAESTLARPAPDGRESPRAALRGYLVACRSGDYTRAAEYLDLEAAPPGYRGEELARRLKVVLDRTIWLDLEEISEAPGGDGDDSLAPDLDSFGSLATDRGVVRLLLERDEGGGWRIAASTVAAVPTLYARFGYGRFVDWLPAPFFGLQLLDVQLWQWLGLILLVAAAYLVAMLLAGGLFRIGARVARRTRARFDDQLLRQTREPVRLLLTIGLFAAFEPLLHLSIPAQRSVGGIETVLVAVGASWLIFRLIDVAAIWFEGRLAAPEQSGLVALLPTLARSAKVIVGTLALLALLQNLGVNVSALLAGLGVGGLAVALAARPTLENLFGGLTLLVDQPIEVGDFCRFGGRSGTIEEIGLRSVRIRTGERTVITVPNSEFSQMLLENVAPRDRILLQLELNLRYETSPDQMRFLLTELRRLLISHPAIGEPRVRFVGLGESSLDVEIYAYVETAAWSDFLAVREDLLLRIMDVVAAAGADFAFPSQTAYLERPQPAGTENRAAAEARVEHWRASGELPFPDLPATVVADLAGSLDYPPRGSVARSRPASD